MTGLDLATVTKIIDERLENKIKIFRELYELNQNKRKEDNEKIDKVLEYILKNSNMPNRVEDLELSLNGNGQDGLKTKIKVNTTSIEGNTTSIKGHIKSHWLHLSAITAIMAVLITLGTGIVIAFT